MTLLSRINADLQTAIRENNGPARDTLRMLKSQIQQEELARGTELDESATIQVLQRAVKTRRDSAGQYREGGRPELAASEEEEIKVIETYLPKALSETELREIIVSLRDELQISSPRDMGQLMKALNARYAGRVDGRLASQIIKDTLAS